ncbi:helix-turn-helix transcriptional regulator [Herbivorax sp. ANBcel31]|uniref:helix-turn-helix domain-containing protein n=1 Tax=Herbivorax sp. ANBcel31 TaxID=3069754 RepID=UPI0027B1A1F3|nr:helix-turn-helix transcriptional regulator [Herbivorax sp. ANBcel31]MDQ2086226.1 helix-turn-helix transcriptional regulator [Herbivorax sp. ANBcel31]
MDVKKIGRFIFELRKEKGYTQKNLAEKLKVTDKAVSRLEKGKDVINVLVLENLSKIFDVSVSEILSGERMEKENRVEKTDRIILDTLDKSNKMRSNMINGIYIAVGIILLIGPLFTRSKLFLNMLSFTHMFFLIPFGMVFITKAIQQIVYENRGKKLNVSKKTMYIGALACQVTALILELLPSAFKSGFFGIPDHFIVTSSYFSIGHIGYGYFPPFLTGVMTILIILLSVINVIKKFSAVKIQNALLTCSTIATLLAHISGVFLGMRYVTMIGCIISILLLISTVLLVFANVQQDRVVANSKNFSS